MNYKEIAKHFDILEEEIKKALFDLKWIEKKGNWILATTKGKENGAEEKYSLKLKRKFVIWEDEIINNEELKAKLNNKNSKLTNKEKKEKGEEYELFVANIYRTKKYYVIEHGKIRGKKDGGIDLIAIKEDEAILIQCKNWNINSKYKITHKDIKTFRTEATDFLEKNDLFKNFNLTIKYIVSNNFLHSSAIKYIEENKKNIDYEIIKIEE